ncbi:hypothetical protein [Candidatus Tisiphia endosymbiont of Hybos culiciformis]|uniref:hypothetical protein n=1 Tax=Candidatus Tisiphia endosymbiont of Hybos culiciformis TaxID=3139331 RepID=UPI003CCB10DB
MKSVVTLANEQYSAERDRREKREKQAKYDKKWANIRANSEQHYYKKPLYNKKPYSWEKGKTDAKNIELLTEITNLMESCNKGLVSANVSYIFEIYNKRYEKLHAKHNKSEKELQKETKLLEKILYRIKYDNGKLNDDNENLCCCIAKTLCVVLLIDPFLYIGLSVEDSIGVWKNRLFGSNDIRLGENFSWLVNNFTIEESQPSSSTHLMPGKIISKLPATTTIVTTAIVENNRTQDEHPSTSSGLKGLGYTNWGKAIEIKGDDQARGIMYEKMIPTSICFKVNSNNIVKIEQYRSIMLPDSLKGETTLQLACSKPNGIRMAAEDAAYLVINYDHSGKLEKMTVPNTPKLSTNPDWPVLTVYHGKVCSLPVSSGTYNWIVQKIQENHGNVVIGHTEDYHLDYFGT